MRRDVHPLATADYLRDRKPASGPAGPAFFEVCPPTGAPKMSDTIRYALLRAVGQKPLAYDTLAGLAAAIHRRRAGRPVEVSVQALAIPGEADTKLMAGVYVLGLDGQRQHFLGYAWVGRTPDPRGRLLAALEALQAPTYGAAEAA